MTGWRPTYERLRGSRAGVRGFKLSLEWNGAGAGGLPGRRTEQVRAPVGRALDGPGWLSNAVGGPGGRLSPGGARSNRRGGREGSCDCAG